MRWHRDVHFRVTVSSPGALPLHFRVLLLLDVPGDGDVVGGSGVVGVVGACRSSVVNAVVVVAGEVAL